ncbi:MAG TPA: hypothetical protein VLJ83_01220 [Gemmatimonadaceae bacterium]|nr:hypothetical protein [Gemmatimonadaceae bacterium]
MPVNFELADGVITLRMVDVYVPGDIKIALLDGLKDPRTTGAVGLLFDVTHSKSLRVRSPDDIVAMGYFLAQYAEFFANRVALVGFDDFPYGMMRMGRVTLERAGVDCEVFRDDANARKWLLAGPS